MTAALFSFLCGLIAGFCVSWFLRFGSGTEYEEAYMLGHSDGVDYERRRRLDDAGVDR